jgi:hypothetical protein
MTVAHPDGCAIMDNIYVQSQRAGERVLKNVRRFLEQKLKVKVNEKKSKVDRPAGCKFLGLRLFWRKGDVAVGVARCRERLRQLTRRTRSGRLEGVLTEINAYMGGWIGYFRLADTPSVFQELDEWLRRRLRQIIWKRWKKPRTRRRNLVALGVPPRTARETVGSGKGYWRLAAAPAVQQALNNTFWCEQGLQSIAGHYHQLRAT